MCGLWKPFDLESVLTTVPPQPTVRRTGIVPFSGLGWNIYAPIFIPEAFAVNKEVEATPFEVAPAMLDSNPELDFGAYASHICSRPGMAPLPTSHSTAVSLQGTCTPPPTGSVLSICIDRMWDLDVSCGGRNVASHCGNPLDVLQRCENECLQQIEDNLAVDGGAVKYDCNQQ